MTKTVYIKREILDWDFRIQSLGSGDLHDVKRPYEMLLHSENLIKENYSEFNLSDSVANLKRALNHRLKAIENYYNLKSIKFSGIPKGYLELLEIYNLARPYIIKKLMEIRNKIEHNDNKPPKKERCMELIDITWYFLKSTDRLIYNIPTDFILAPDISFNLADKYECTLEILRSKNKFTLNGWLPSIYILKKNETDSFKIICSVFHDGTYWENKDKEYHKDKTKDDTWLIGNFSLSENEKQVFLKKCLATY